MDDSVELEIQALQSIYGVDDEVTVNRDDNG